MYNIHMRKDKNEAVELRKSGMSYREISERLKIPKSTLSEWFSDETWSKTVKTKLAESAKDAGKARMVDLNKIRGYYLERAYREAKEEAVQELEALKYNPLFISGMMLYWGEGDKMTRSVTRLANSDPELIRFYVRFLKEACGIPEKKIRAQLLIYPDIEEETNRRFWSFVSGLSFSHFTKSILIQGRHEKKRLRYGVCTILVSSTYFKVKMLEWLNLLPKALLEKEYYENIWSVRKKNP